MKLNVLVSTKEQFFAVLGSTADVVYFETAFFPETDWAMMAKQAKEAGKRLFPALPAVFREDAFKYFAGNVQSFQSAGFDGVLSRNTEGLFFLKELGVSLPFTSDHFAYLWNPESKAVLSEAGFTCFTLPVELSKDELLPVSGPDTELIVYGYLPMMTTANCLKKTFASCDRKSGRVRLTDRDGREMTVLCQCRFCTNVILNPVPLDLADRMKDVLRISPGSIRLQFTVEDADKTREMIRRFETALSFPDRVERPGGPFTRGAFLRGTE